MEPVFYVVLGVVAAAVAAGLIFVFIRNNKINKEGKEATAVVSRVKEIESTDSDGCTTTTYEYYVRYTTEAGESVEAKLGNAPRRAKEGDELKIKYLPEKPKYVRWIKE